MLASARIKIGEGGRLVIPAAFRRELGIEFGHEVILTLDDGGLRVVPLDAALSQARALVRKYNPKHQSLAKTLIDVRKKESRG